MLEGGVCKSTYKHRHGETHAKALKEEVVRITRAYVDPKVQKHWGY
jgi:hypothetical protein